MNGGKSPKATGRKKNQHYERVKHEVQEKTPVDEPGH